MRLYQCDACPNVATLGRAMRAALGPASLRSDVAAAAQCPPPFTQEQLHGLRQLLVSPPPTCWRLRWGSACSHGDMCVGQRFPQHPAVDVATPTASDSLQAHLEALAGIDTCHAPLLQVGCSGGIVSGRYLPGCCQRCHREGAFLPLKRRLSHSARCLCGRQACSDTWKKSWLRWLSTRYAQPVPFIYRGVVLRGAISLRVLIECMVCGWVPPASSLCASCAPAVGS